MNKHEIVCYETDASRIKGTANKVVFPKTIEEVQKIIKTSNIDIVPRGAGTGLVGGCIPDKSIIVDMGKMNKVTNFLPLKKTVRVEAGITLKELNEKLNSIGFEFPIDSLNRGISTIGGMIARNASGDRSMRYGNMRDWIEEIEFVNGRGELMKTSKADLTDVCGMEGITGIIIGATLKLAPLVKRSASVFQSDNINEVLSIARKLKSEREVVLLELFSPYVSRLLGLPEKYNLIIEFNSERGKIKGGDYEEISKLRENVFYKLASEGYYNMEDPKFFYDKLKEYILFLEENNVPYIGHLGVGIIHPFFKDSVKINSIFPDSTPKKYFEGFLGPKNSSEGIFRNPNNSQRFADNENIKRESVIEFIKKTKAIPGRFGIGTRRKYFIDGFQAKLIQRVKVRHDPFCKLNKGKIIDVSGYSVHRKDKIVGGEVIEKALGEVEDKVSSEKAISDSSDRIGSDKSESAAEDSKIVAGEELSAIEVIREVGECDEASSLSSDNEGQEKTPEEKLEDFIKEIELKDKIQEKMKISSVSEETEGQEEIGKESETQLEVENKEKDFEVKKGEGKEAEETVSNELSFQEVQEKLKDYEETFISELKEDKVQQVEEIAKKIPREIVRNEIEFRPREKVKVDYNQIRDIMTNKAKASSNFKEFEGKASSNFKEFEGKASSNFKEFEGQGKESKVDVVNEGKLKEEGDQNNDGKIKVGKVSLSDNLDRKNELSDEDRDLINRILGNRYKKDENKGVEKNDN